MFKNKLTLFYAVAFFAFVTYLFFRCNSYYEKLSGNSRGITVAHVFSRDTGSKGSIYYNYIYKVDNDYYSTSTSGSNLRNLDSICPQCFLLAYYKPDPTIHTVIWSYRFDTIISLGSKLDTLKFDESLIKKHTISWNGLSPKSNINDKNVIDSYEKKTSRTL